MWMLVGDLHFTDQARDAHRFDIFDWIVKQQAKHKPAATFLAGDITDSKDRHSATLVNNIVNGLMKLKRPVYILMGNHDYRDPNNPFFKFLNHIDGIHFVIEPTVIKAIKPIGLIPHVRTQDAFDDAVRAVQRGNAGISSYLVHQTFEGAIAEAGVRLSGLSASLIESLNPPLGVYAGDVHKPQTQGLVTYIGCPYQVRFGDNFEPRCILVREDGTEVYPWFDAPRKWSLKIRGPENLLNNTELMEGDQVKLVIELPREEAVEWKQVRESVLAACKKLKLEVYGAKVEVKAAKRRERVYAEAKPSHDHAKILEQFCTAENVSSQIRKTGLQLLGD